MTSKRLQVIAIVMAVIAVIVSAIAVVVVEKRNEPDPVASPAPADAMRSEQHAGTDAAVTDPQPPEDPPDRHGACTTTACAGANDCPAHDCECDGGRVVHTRSCVNGCCSNKADACASSCDR